MTTAQLREHVANLYPGPKWRARVRDMSEAQVFRIYKEKQELEQKKKEGVT